jgi:hypothetical protein
MLQLIPLICSSCLSLQQRSWLWFNFEDWQERILCERFLKAQHISYSVFSHSREIDIETDERFAAVEHHFLERYKSELKVDLSRRTTDGNVHLAVPKTTITFEGIPLMSQEFLNKQSLLYLGLNHFLHTHSNIPLANQGLVTFWYRPWISQSLKKTEAVQGYLVTETEGRRMEVSFIYARP